MSGVPSFKSLLDRWKLNFNNLIKMKKDNKIPDREISEGTFYLNENI